MSRFFYKNTGAIKLRQAARHRLVGLVDHEVVSEIWQQTNEILSNE